MTILFHWVQAFNKEMKKNKTEAMTSFVPPAPQFITQFFLQWSNALLLNVLNYGFFITVFESLIYHLIVSLTLRIFCLLSYLNPTSFNYILLFIFLPSWSVPNNEFSLLFSLTISVWRSCVFISFNLRFQIWPFITGFQTAISDIVLLILMYSPQNSENKVCDNNSENH